MTPGIKFEGVDIPSYASNYIRTVGKDISVYTCIQLCLQHDACVVSEYYDNTRNCYRYYPSRHYKTPVLHPFPNIKAAVFIYPSKIRVSGVDMTFSATAVVPDISPRDIKNENENHHCNIQACRKACYDDAICFAFTFCSSCRNDFRCKLYTEKGIAMSTNLPIETERDGMTTVFISRNDDYHNNQKIPRC